MTQLTLDEAFKARDLSVARVERKAERHVAEFTVRAAVFVVEYLKAHGPTSGEDVTLACREAGIVPHDDRAFGAVYLRLSRSRLIEKAGVCARKRWHGTGGGNIWKAKGT